MASNHCSVDGLPDFESFVLRESQIKPNVLVRISICEELFTVRVLRIEEQALLPPWDQLVQRSMFVVLLEIRVLLQHSLHSQTNL